MEGYVALLRGINVGGKNAIKMAELRELLAARGFGNVQTYIQSGNILFESDEPEAALADALAALIRDQFSVHTQPVLRTAAQFQALVRALPFTDRQIENAKAQAPGVEVLYVAFSDDALEDARAETLMRVQGTTEFCRVAGRDIYLLFDQSVRTSRLAAALTKLKTPLTLRNWNTVVRIAEMLNVYT